MRLDKDAVASRRNRCPRYGLYHLGTASRHASGGVGLLQRVGDVDDDGHAGLLHLGYAAHVDDEVAVAEGSAAFGKGNLCASGGAHLVDGKAHRRGCQELSLLDIHHLAGLGRCHKQVGLAAEEGRNLQDVDVLGGHFGLLGQVDVGDDGHAELGAHLCQHLQRLFVADAGERVDARAVGLAVAAFEDVGDAQAAAQRHNLRRDVECHVLALDYAGAGQQEKVADGRRLEV